MDTYIPRACLTLGIAALVALPAPARAGSLNVCGLVTPERAAQILGHAVDTSHSGDTSVHCAYVGKSAYADLRVMPFVGDSHKVSMLMGGGKAPPGHSFVYGRKNSYLVYVTTAPKNDTTARALLDAAIARL